MGRDIREQDKIPLAIVRQIRETLGEDFIIVYRLSMLDLVEGGSTWTEVVQLAKAIEKAGATIIKYRYWLARSQGSNYRYPCAQRRFQLGNA